MTITKEMQYSISEVLDILKHTDEEEMERIPLDVIKELNSNKDESYVSIIDYTKPLKESKISSKALSMLAYIYKEYLSDDEEKDELDKKLYDNQMKNAEQYSVEKVFEERKANKNEFLPVVIVHESLFRKIINKIKKLFKI